MTDTTYVSSQEERPTMEMLLENPGQTLAALFVGYGALVSMIGLRGTRR
jgi:hypothetical protein